MANQMNESGLNDLLQKNFNAAAKRTSAQNITLSTVCYLSWPDRIHLRFDNCVFEHDITMQEILSESEVIFSGCIFKGKLSILGSTSRVIYKVLHSQLEQGFEIEQSEAISLWMGGSTGKGEFILDGAIFETCSFEGFSYRGSDESDDVMSFRGCIFNLARFMDAVLGNCSFNKATFKSDVSFDRTVFNYHHSPGTGNFFDVVFQGGAYFNGTDFTMGAMFNAARFMAPAIFVGCNNGHDDCVGDFSGCIFERRAFFDSSKFKTLVIKHTEFREVVSFNGIQCKQLKLSKNVFLQYADFLDAKIDMASRDVFRTIKNEFLRHNNTVEAFVYQARELRMYEQSLSWKKQRREKFVLWFYKVSNDFGVNWVRAFGFTLLVSVIFYIFYLPTLGHLPFAWGWRGLASFGGAINTTVEYFFKFFIVTHDLDFMKTFNPNAGSYLVDSVGRIFIGYGIYQTVQAFRKYGK